MACYLEDVYLQFESSGMRIAPMNVDIRQERGKDSWGQAEVHAVAAQHVSNSLVPKEPVSVVSHGKTVFRGFVKGDSVSVGQTTGTVKIYDPLKLLESGMIEKEWLKTSLREVAEYVWNEVDDPEGVFSGLEFTGPSTTVMEQHPEQGITHLTGGLIELDGVQNWLRESIPFVSGEGHFDYEKVTPREAFVDICQAFKIQMFTRMDGAFCLGLPDMAPNVYTCGVRQGTWKLTDFSLPQRDDPFGVVYVKGRQSKTFNGPIENAPARFVKDLHNVTPWAAAAMGGYDGKPITIEYTKTDDKQVLQDVAKRTLVQQYERHTRGSVEVDALSAVGGAEQMGPLKTGDVLGVAGEPDCGVPGGTYRIESIMHSIGTRDGWTIDFGLVGIPQMQIQTKAWDYWPLDTELNSMDPTKFWVFTSPLIGASIAMGFAESILQDFRGGQGGVRVPSGGFDSMLPASPDQVLDTVADSVSDAAEDTAETIGSFLP